MFTRPDKRKKGKVEERRRQEKQRQLTRRERPVEGGGIAQERQGEREGCGGEDKTRQNRNTITSDDSFQPNYTEERRTEDAMRDRNERRVEEKRGHENRGEQ